MKVVLSDLEGLRIASEMEKRGVEMYRHASRISKKREAIDLLKRLEEDETRHQANFTEQYEKGLRENAHDAPYSEEDSAYLAALAAEVVFPGGLIGLARGAGVDDPVQILHSAIASEKDSILFYDEMAYRTRSEDARRVFQEIARQERQHMLELMGMLTKEEP